MNINVLSNRLNLLKRKIRILKDNLISAPEGVLYIKHDGELTRFYRKLPDQSKHIYLSSKTDKELIKKLSNKNYSSKALKSAEEELKILNRLLKHENDNPLSGVYDCFDESVRQFIDPVEINVKEKIRLFKQRIPTDSSQFIRTGQYVIKTTRGEYVKSMAEFIIAESLLKHNVPYIYEDKVKTIDNQRYKPDFTAINIRTGKILLWEHFGMLENPKYLDDNISKLESFRLMGCYPGNGMIITMSSKQQPIKEETVDYIVRNSFLK